MSTGDQMSEQHECAGDAAAYVLGALDREESGAFVRHMESCVVCRDEVATLTQVADALPLAAPQYAAPAQLRRRVMRAVRTEPRGVPEAAPRRQRRPWQARQWLPGGALALSAATVVAVAVIAGALIGSGGSGSNGTRVFRASVGDAVLRLSGDHGELVVSRLPAPPAGHIYEVWVKRGNRAPSPTGTLFSVTSSGRGDVGVPGSLKGVSAVMVTSEPAGGTTVPTGAPVVVASLT
jgi:anti-sigma-K factor RskA